MRVALLSVLVCAAIDLLVCLGLLAVVWLEHRRVRREAAASGEPIASANGTFGCLIGGALVGFALVTGTAWVLFAE